jgi:hypothetical protein
MPKKTCPVENLISSQYCQISVCMECRIINLNLPGRISFQFEMSQFFEIANNFHKAARMIKAKTEPKQKGEKIIKLTYLH